MKADSETRYPGPDTRKALVTGGAGFIGSHLVRRLLAERYEVRVLDDLSSGFLDNLPLTHSPLTTHHSPLTFIHGDVRDIDACKDACAGMEGGTVFQLAAMVSVVRSVEDPLLSNAVNVGGTLNMLIAARDSGVSRFVLSSSAAVYGNAESNSQHSTLNTQHRVSEDQPLDPQSPYASDKAAAEFYCRNFHALYGLETVILRYFNVFGSKQNIASGYAAVIPAFISATMRNQSPVIYGDGRQTRDFVHVDNVVSANLLAAQVAEAAGQTFNIATGEETDLLTLLSIIADCHLTLNTQHPTPNFLPGRAGEVRNSCADIRRARALLGYEVKVSLMDGLAATIESARDSKLGATLAAV